MLTKYLPNTHLWSSLFNIQHSHLLRLQYLLLNKHHALQCITHYFDKKLFLLPEICSSNRIFLLIITTVLQSMIKIGHNALAKYTMYMTYLFPGDITISDNITFTEDSDLNGASPQFTLTCISTGGPATTVTWTRDSDTVTEGNETVLDDPVTAQYTHTLTVTGRLGGLYTCTVANNKPSEDSAQLSVQGIVRHV